MTESHQEPLDLTYFCQCNACDPTVAELVTLRNAIAVRDNQMRAFSGAGLPTAQNLQASMASDPSQIPASPWLTEYMTPGEFYRRYPQPHHIDMNILANTFDGDKHPPLPEFPAWPNSTGNLSGAAANAYWSEHVAVSEKRRAIKDAAIYDVRDMD